MNKLILALSIIAVVFIMTFFGVQIFFIKNNNDFMPDNLKIIFGIGLLIISICIFIFLIISRLGRIRIPAFIEVVLFEIFLVAVAIGAVSFFLIFKK